MADLTTSRRDRHELESRLESWLRSALPGADARIVDLVRPESNGMSSETLLFDAEWTDEATERRSTHPLVARVAPAVDDVPVFRTYDMATQFRVMDLVGSASTVPVPTVHWLEEDPDALGAPFFIMERIEGRVPPDNMPYTMQGWLLDASAGDRRALQDAAIDVLAGIHAIDVDPAVTDILAGVTAGAGDDRNASPLRRHVADARAYYDWMRGDLRYPVLEDSFDWLDEHWPLDEGDAAISWGDARIGNMMFSPAGFHPVAVLDWEMAAIGPPGIDLGWMVFIHQFFQDVATMFEEPGLPEMFRSDEVSDRYGSAGGRAPNPADAGFYEVYGALRHGLVMARVHDRRVAFGQARAARHPDEAILHAPRLRQMLEW